MTHTLTLQAIEPVTHDTHHLVFERPENYAYTPGQATLLRLDRDGWREKKRPFTFTGLEDADQLEFVIKSYPDHDGVTEQIGKLTPGDKVIIGNAWGAIEDKGPGTFIAGGAGVTPFIGILRNRVARNGDAGGSTLLFANKKEEDIILRDEWIGMPGLREVFVVEEGGAPNLPQGRIDDDFLGREVRDWDKPFYVCGPPPMIEAVVDALKARDVPAENIVTEDM